MGMFNIYDEIDKQQASPMKTGMSYAALSPGRGSVALAGQAGQMMGQGAMGAMGFKTPAQQRQANIMKVREQFPNPQTDAEFRSLGNALNAIGETDMAEQAFDQIKDTGKITATQKQTNADMEATLAFLESSKGIKLTPEEAAYFKSRIKKDVSVTMGGQVVDTAPNVFDQIVAARGDKTDSSGIGDTGLTQAALEKKVGDLSTKVLKADLSDLDVALTEAEKMFAKYGDKNIPGLSQLNIIERQTKEGAINSGIVESVKNILLKLRSGAAVTESEQKRFLNEISGAKIMTDELWKDWISRIRKLVEQKKSDLFAGERQDVLDLYWERQGTGFKKTSQGSTTSEQQSVLDKYGLK